MSQTTRPFLLRLLRVLALTAVAMLISGQSLVHAQGVLGAAPESNPPVHVSQGATPLVMLTMARDHSLFFGAYNDLTDLEGTGAVNFKFLPTFEYGGLFNSAYCYAYTGKTDSTNTLPAGLDSYFKPVGDADPLSSAYANPGGCTSGASATKWSGNWLNYVTTSRIDAMRVALYGGHRIKDGVYTDPRPVTLLRRAYIPQDGHAWAKEYTSVAVNGYDISKYTPFALPIIASGVQTRHFFGNLTSTVIRDVTSSGARNPAGIHSPTSPVQVTGNPPGGLATWSTANPDLGIDCSTLSNCSNFPPVMRVVLNAGSRVWRWAGSQRPVLDYHPFPIGWTPAALFVYPNKGNFEGYGNLYDDLAHYVTPQPAYPTDYTVQVEVCVAPNFLNGCKQYGTSGQYNYKPVGVLHDYGENDSLKFGLLTGSYDSNLSGGRLRKT